MDSFLSFKYRTNNYAAVLIEADSLPDDTAVLLSDLPLALDHWRTAGLRSVWLEIPIQKAHLISAATSHGFEFHSTDPDALTLTLKLAEDVNLPAGPTHQIATGSVVINDKNELLVIVERAHAKTMPNFFKLPGGAVDPGERLEEAAEREVWEETGVKARFEQLTMFRHWVNYRPNMSDIYFICRLTPLTSALTPQASEIDRALWMPLDEYLNHPDVSVFNKKIVELSLGNDGLKSGQFEGYDLNERTLELFFKH